MKLWKLESVLRRFVILASGGAMMFQATSCTNNPQAVQTFLYDFATGFSYMFLLESATTALTF